MKQLKNLKIYLDFSLQNLLTTSLTMLKCKTQSHNNKQVNNERMQASNVHHLVHHNSQ